MIRLINHLAIWQICKVLTLVIILAVYFLVATHLSGNLFDYESHSAAFDSLAESLIHGDCSVSPSTLGNESHFTNSKPTMYFGSFPALLRIVSSAFVSVETGKFSRFSGLLAAFFSVLAFVGILGRSFFWHNSSSSNQAGYFLILTLLAFALGTPIIFLLSAMSIYHEAMLWGLFWSLLGLWCLWSRKLRLGQLVLFSICCAGALLSRVTFALPLFAILVYILIGESWLFFKQSNFSKDIVLAASARFFALLLPISLGLGFQLWYNDCRYGDWTVFTHDLFWRGKPIEKYGGILNVLRTHIGFLNYFLLLPIPQQNFPFFSLSYVYYPATKYFTDGYREYSISQLLVSPFIIAGAFMGYFGLLNKRLCVESSNPKLPKYLIFASFAFLLEALLMFTYFFQSLRFAAEFLPFLISGFAIFMARVDFSLSKFCYTFLAILSLWTIIANIWMVIAWHQMPMNHMVNNNDKLKLVEFSFRQP